MNAAKSAYWMVQASSATTDTWVELAEDKTADVQTRVEEYTVALQEGRPDVPTPFPAVVWNRGRWVGDMLWAGAEFVLVSQRVIDTLTAMDATGWRSMPATVHYKNSEELPGSYHLFVATGECDYFLDGAEDAPPDPLREVTAIPGWDGSDVFWIRGRKPQFTFCVTNEVLKAFQAAKLARINFEHPYG